MYLSQNATIHFKANKLNVLGVLKAKALKNIWRNENMVIIHYTWKEHKSSRNQEDLPLPFPSEPECSWNLSRSPCQKSLLTQLQGTWQPTVPSPHECPGCLKTIQNGLQHRYSEDQISQNLLSATKRKTPTHIKAFIKCHYISHRLLLNHLNP